MEDVEHFVVNNDRERLVHDLENGKKRSCTNIFSLILLNVFFTVWAGIGIYAYCSSVSFFDVISRKSYEKAIFDFQSQLYNDRLIILCSISLSILFLILYLIFIRYLPRCTVYVTCFTACIFSVISLLLSFVFSHSVSGFYYICINIVSFLFLGLIIHAIMKVGIDDTCKVMVDSIRAMVYFPSSILIAVAQICSNILIIYFCLSTIFYLFAPYYVTTENEFSTNTHETMEENPKIQYSTEYPNYSDYWSKYEMTKSYPEMQYQTKYPSYRNYTTLQTYDSKRNFKRNVKQINYEQHLVIYETSPTAPLHIYILAFISICSSLWIIYFVHHIARAMLHGCFVVWFKAEDKKAVSNTELSKQHKNIFRFHLGTLAFGSTVFTKIQVLQAIFASKELNVFKSFVTFLSFIFILGYATTNALIISVIYGKNFFGATKDSIKFLMKNNLKFVAFRGVTSWIQTAGLLFITMVPVGLYYLYIVYLRVNYSYSYSSHMNYVPAMVVFGCINILITVMVLYIFNAANEAVIHCSLDKTYFESQNIEYERRVGSGDQVFHT